MISNGKPRNDIIHQSFTERFSKGLLPLGGEIEPQKMSFRIAGIYMVIGSAWILLSDKVVQMIAVNKETITNLSIVKGWVYVFVTGLIIFGMIYSALRRIQADDEKIMRSYQELAATNQSLSASQEDLRRQFELVVESQEELRASQEKMHYLAYHDQLTGLPNRLSLYEYAAKKLPAGVDLKTALLFIDIDNFKLINDTMGHAFGDEIIRSTGKRLTALLNNQCFIYRLGGDEFVVLAEGISNYNDVRLLANQILERFKEPFLVEGSVININISFGIALRPEHGTNIDELLRCADIAMYKAKEDGKNCFVTYQPAMNQTFFERMNIEKQLRSAMECNEFELYYQPQFDLKNNTITGMEALLRWNNRELGAVPPLKFIEIAEETRMIIPIGQWVLKTACQFLRGLHDRGFESLTVSVNVSIIQLLQNDFADWVFGILAYYGLKPKDLEIEITESVFMESYDSIGGNLDQFYQKGVGIALDDFGKGYSSLSYLTHLPITSLKIDKSFVDSISTEHRSKSLTGQIVMLGKSLGMAIVAEGVETREQLDYLTHYQCDKIQGYFFSKPLPAPQLEVLILKK